MGGEVRESAESKTTWLFEEILPFPLSEMGSHWRVLSVKR